MAGSRDLKVKIVGDSSSLNRAFKDSARGASRFGKAMKVGLLAAGAAAAVGVGAAVVGLKKSVEAAAEAEVSQKRLQTQLKALGISYQEHGKIIDDTLQKQSMLSAFDDEDLADSFSNLVRLTGDVNKALELNSLAADIARGKGIELSSATSIVTKAQMGMVGSLRRQGIEIAAVTTAQDKLKKGASDSAKEQAKAQDLIATKQAAIAALQEKFAGQAKAFGETAVGAQERLGVAMENLGEVIGAKVLPHLVPLVNGLADFINRAAESERLGQILTTVGDVITTVAGLISTTFQQLAVAAEKHWPRVKKAVQNVVDYYKTQVAPAFQNVKTAVIQTWDSMGKELQDSIRSRFLSVPPLIEAQLRNILSVVKIFVAVLKGDWGKAWDEIKAIVSRTLGALVQTVKMLGSDIANALLAAGKLAMKGLHQGMQSGFAAVARFVESLPGKIRTAAGDFGAVLYAAGVAVLQGFLNGLIAKFEAVKTFILGIAGWIRDNKGPPAQDKMLLYAAGQLIIQGLQDGMEMQWGRLQQMVNGLSSDLSTRIGKVVDAAIAAIEERKGAFGSAFDNLASAALSAFDKLSSDFQTRTEKKIAAQDAKRAAQERQGALATAKAGLAEAQLGGDPQAILDAQKQVDEALFQIQRAADEKRAAQERTAYEQQRERQRVALENRLSNLQNNFLQGELTVQQFTARMTKILDKAGIPLQGAAAKLGFALATGLREAKKDAVRAAQELAREIVNQLGNISVSVRVHVSRTDAPDADKRAQGGPVTKGHQFLVGEKGPELFIPHASGRIISNADLNRTSSMTPAGGGATVHFHFPNYLGDRSELTRAIQEADAQWQRANGGRVI